jgi:hypothetical protein
MPATLPPPQYDHPPSIPVIEHVLIAEEVDAICHAPPCLGHGWPRAAAGISVLWLRACHRAIVRGVAHR